MKRKATKEKKEEEERVAEEGLYWNRMGRVAESIEVSVGLVHELGKLLGGKK